MKKDLVDISLSELREFIKNSDELYHNKISHLSIISIKLRLQFLIFKNQFNSFSAFYMYYLSDENYRAIVHKHLTVSGNELFRDAEHWEFLMNKLTITKQSINICVFDSANFHDTVTLLICLKRCKLINNVSITVVAMSDNIIVDSQILFNEKDIEIGNINFSSLKSNEELSNYIIKKDSNKYVFDITSNINFINIKDIDKNDVKNDVVIARNITLNYNFSEHEVLFDRYLKLLKNKGILFVGNKEGFKWCSHFNHITFSNKSIPIYKKL